MTFKKVAFTFALSICYTNAFVPNPLKGGSCLHTKSSESVNNPNVVLSMSMSEAEALLAKARALRQQAAEDEHKLHSTLIEKKNCQNMETDTVIQTLFPLHGDNTSASIASRMEEHRYSAPMLKKVVERLHEREISAKGVDHVEPSHNDREHKVEFVRVAQPQKEELERVEGLIQKLIDAAEILDEKYLKNEELQKKHHHHVDDTHWSSGNLSKVLKEKAHFLRREHEAEFKNRLEEFYEAARKKHDYESYEMR